jgi:hypothetical protein
MYMLLYIFISSTCGIADRIIKNNLKLEVGTNPRPLVVPKKALNPEDYSNLAAATNKRIRLHVCSYPGGSLLLLARNRPTTILSSTPYPPPLPLDPAIVGAAPAVTDRSSQLIELAGSGGTSIDRSFPHSPGSRLHHKPLATGSAPWPTEREDTRRRRPHVQDRSPRPCTARMHHHLRSGASPPHPPPRSTGRRPAPPLSTTATHHPFVSVVVP